MSINLTNLPEELKTKFKALLAEFSLVAPITPVPVVPSTPAPVAKFGEATAEDGTILKWEGDAPLAVGTPLMVIDPANPTAFLPAPDGEVKMQDGSVIVIKEGKVESLTPAPAPEVPAVPATPAPDMTAQFEKELSEVKESFSKVSSEKDALKSEIEELKKQFEAFAKVTKESFEVFGKAMESPSANPTEIKSNAFSKKKPFWA